MSVTETYRLVHSARGKLTREAQRSEHDLRLLVGHANLLDSLMIELERAEDQQSTWYNTTPQKTWATATVDEVQEASDEADSDDSDYDDEDDMDMIPVRLHGTPEYRPQFAATSEDDSDDAVTDSDEEDDEEDDISDDEDAHDLALALCRTQSRNHGTHSSNPPELVSDSDDSDDDSTLPSPPQLTVDYTPAKSRDLALLSNVRSKPRPEDALYEDGFYIPSHAQSAPMVATC